MRGDFRVVPLQPNIGAEIEGIDLREPLTEENRDLIYDALLRHKVIFFRDQDIERDQHVALGRCFGDLEPSPNTSPTGYAHVFELYGDASKRIYSDIWHTDQTSLVAPPLGAILRAVTLPKLGGDTVFSNTSAAYAGLDSKVKERIDNLRAVHDHTKNLHRFQYPPEKEAEIVAKNRPVEQPVVSVHPDTGEHIIFVNPQYTTHIVGMEESESRELLNLLYGEIIKPEYQVRFSWRPHSIAFWDNRSTQHYAISDYKEPRRMERIAIQGQPVLGIHDVLTPYKLPSLGGSRDGAPERKTRAL